MSYKYINKEVALKFLDNNIQLYKNLLEGFIEQYKDINFLNLDDPSFFKQVHQLKSISKSIGANELFNLVDDINRTKSREKEILLQKMLTDVLNTIKELSLNEINSTLCSKYTHYTKEELFEQILNGAIKNRPKKVEEPLERLKQLPNLTKGDKLLITKLDKEIKIYNFKNIITILSK